MVSEFENQQKKIGLAGRIWRRTRKSAKILKEAEEALPFKSSHLHWSLTVAVEPQLDGVV